MAGSVPSKKKAQAVQMKTYKPRTPGLRHYRRPLNEHLWKGSPFRALTYPKKGHGKGGRNHSGRITVRHHGGGVARRIRIVDFMRVQSGPHTVERIEFDPGRSGHIALISSNATGEKSYILAPDGLRAGHIVESYRSGLPQDLVAPKGEKIDPGILAARTTANGNCLPLHMIPVGTVIHNVGSHKDGKAVFCRSAGTYATLVSKEQGGQKSDYATVKLQSGETRLVSRHACATIGVVSNPQWQYRQLGKAGRSRRLNIRPTVRGLAMNACEFLFSVSDLTKQLSILMVVEEENQRAIKSLSALGICRYVDRGALNQLTN
jgi:ribosomal protein L2